MKLSHQVADPYGKYCQNGMRMEMRARIDADRDLAAAADARAGAPPGT